MERFVVVAWHGGIPYILQYRNVLNWYFINNRTKVFKTKKTAIKEACKIMAKYRSECVKVYSITENESVYGDAIRKWEREEAERIAFELVTKTNN